MCKNNNDIINIYAWRYISNNNIYYYFQREFGNLFSFGYGKSILASNYGLSSISVFWASLMFFLWTIQKIHYIKITASHIRLVLLTQLFWTCLFFSEFHFSFVRLHRFLAILKSYELWPEDSNAGNLSRRDSIEESHFYQAWKMLLVCCWTQRPKWQSIVVVALCTSMLTHTNIHFYIHTRIHGEPTTQKKILAENVFDDKFAANLLCSAHYLR